MCHCVDGGICALSRRTLLTRHVSTFSFGTHNGLSSIELTRLIQRTHEKFETHVRSSVCFPAEYMYFLVEAALQRREFVPFVHEAEPVDATATASEDVDMEKSGATPGCDTPRSH